MTDLDFSVLETRATRPPCFSSFFPMRCSSVPQKTTNSDTVVLDQVLASRPKESLVYTRYFAEMEQI